MDGHNFDRSVAARIVEAVMIAVIASALTAAGASALVIAAMRVEVEQVKAQVDDLKHEVRDMRGVIYRPSWDRNTSNRSTNPSREDP